MPVPGTIDIVCNLFTPREVADGHTEQRADFLLTHPDAVAFADFRQPSFADCFTDVGCVFRHGVTAISSSA